MSLIIALGSNIGEKKLNLQSALEKLILNFGQPIHTSNIYLSKAYGVTDQPDFYNAVIEFQIPAFDAHRTLDICLKIEESMGRVRLKKWGPRIIDIDILYFGNATIKTDDLTIPHPFINDRDFVLLPLSELPFFTEIKDSVKQLHQSTSCTVVDQFC